MNEGHAKRGESGGRNAPGQTKPKPVIAIDGPAGAGKSTVAKLLADKLGLAYVDTGATYRVVAHRALQDSVPLDDAERLAVLAKDTLERTELTGGRTLSYDGHPIGPEIRTPEVSEATSIVATHPEVRSVVVGYQRQLVPPHGAVVEGRDIGTVVWPDADLKAYLIARPDVRAQRRSDVTGRPDAQHTEVHERDARDAGRPVGAMKPAADALVIDTSDATPDEIALRLASSLKARKRGRFYVVLRFLLSALLRGAFRLEVTGAANIPKRGGVILAPNHRSLIDHPVVGVITRRQVWFMGKEELFRSKLAAKLLGALGAFPVRRGRPDRKSLKRGLELLESGEVIGIYPEGTRRPENRFEELEEGFAYIAMKSGAPVVPIAISGTEAVLPRGRKFPKFVKIRVAIGEPFRLGSLESGVMPRSRIRDATAEAHQRFQALIDRLEPR